MFGAQHILWSLDWSRILSGLKCSINYDYSLILCHHCAELCFMVLTDWKEVLLSLSRCAQLRRGDVLQGYQEQQGAQCSEGGRVVDWLGFGKSLWTTWPRAWVTKTSLIRFCSQAGFLPFWACFLVFGGHSEGRQTEAAYCSKYLQGMHKLQRGPHLFPLTLN